MYKNCLDRFNYEYEWKIFAKISSEYLIIEWIKKRVDEHTKVGVNFATKVCVIFLIYAVQFDRVRPIKPVWNESARSIVKVARIDRSTGRVYTCNQFRSTNFYPCYQNRGPCNPHATIDTQPGREKIKRTSGQETLDNWLTRADIIWGIFISIFQQHGLAIILIHDVAQD